MIRSKYPNFWHVANLGWKEHFFAYVPILLHDFKKVKSYYYSNYKYLFSTNMIINLVIDKIEPVLLF